MSLHIVLSTSTPCFVGFSQPISGMFICIFNRHKLTEIIRGHDIFLQRGSTTQQEKSLKLLCNRQEVLVVIKCVGPGVSLPGFES